MSPGSQPLLFLESREAHGGDVQVLLDILRALDGSRYHPIVACLPDGPIADRKDLPEHVEIVPLSFGRVPGGPLAKARDLVRTVLVLRRLMADRGVQLVHTNNTRRTLTAAVALKAVVPHKFHLVYHAHCEPQGSAAHRAGLRLASRVWCCSSFVADAHEDVGVDRAKVRILHNGFDFGAPWPDADSSLRTRFDIPEAAPIAVLVGRLSPVKGQMLAIESLAQSACPPDLHLVLVGDDSIADRNEGYRRDLVRIAAEFGLERRVHLAGFVADPRPFYGAADVVLIPSYREPFGLTALEAAAAGRAIVASGSGGLVEVLGEVGGVRLAEREPSSFAVLIGQAVEGRQDPAPELVRARLAETFSMASFAGSLEQLLLELAEGDVCEAGQQGGGARVPSPNGVETLHGGAQARVERSEPPLATASEE